MPAERNRAVPAVYLLLRRDKEILLMRRQGSGFYDGWYGVPSGHVEAGELPIQALLREAKEELGIDLNPKDLHFVHAMYRTKNNETGDRADFFFEATQWSGEIQNAEPHKCTDIQWFPIENLPSNTMHFVKDAIRWAGEGVLYSELNPDYFHKNPPPQ